ncbi:choline-phosphate cytidylyltransferase B [Tothia fuscella]|uniref:choline-phosphate cytidylyltransferase n=1 Tax=Tothia fuscella TaxID=1048955 RepID=A0A9P4NSP0_9PEZI|nr:choline-phosphate cytidylyltransferase B [Tothia fuscella]
MAPKRKRANTQSNQVNNPGQASSRDASGEDTEDPILQEVTLAKHKNDDAEANGEGEVGAPAIKRSRSNNPPEDGSRPGLGRNASSFGAEGESVEERLERGEGGEAGTMRMEDPPKAGLVDPVGYHTNPPPTDRPVRIYADGVFDLFHIGHMRALQQAKIAFPDVHLLVGVTGDTETHRRKGLTVLSARERAESVRHCKWVDEVIEDCPWIIADVPEFIEKHKIDYVAHDDIPYGADEGDDIYADIKKAGKFLVTQRTEGLSTTGIITKIVRDYDKYISRQLQRGTSRQELNVSWIKKQEMEMKRTVTELRDSIRTNWLTTGQELGKDLRGLISRPSSPAPGRNKEPNDGGHGSGAALTSPTALAHLSHLDVPTSSPAGANGAGGSGSQQKDFATGYALGLVGGVRNWMARSKRNLNDSRAESPDSADDSGSPMRSPTHEVPRGRQGKHLQDEIDAQVASEMK